MSTSYIILDLEATGLFPEKGDVVIDLAAIRCTEQGVVETFQSFIHPGEREVTPFIQNLTGISLETLAQAPTSDVVFAKFKEFLGDEKNIIVGHNVSFDTNFLSHYGFDFSECPHVDTNDFSVVFYPEVSSHSLEVLSSLFGFEHKEKHTALSDVHATHALLNQLLSHYDTISDENKSVLQNAFLESTWGGRFFFSLPRCIGYVPKALMESENAQIDIPASHAFEDFFVAPMQDAFTREQGTFISLPADISFASVLEKVSSEEVKDFVLITNKDKVDLCRTPLLDKKLLPLDSVSSFVRGSALQRETLNPLLPGTELFFLRAVLGNIPKTIFHISKIRLTHKERQAIRSFLCTDQDDHDALADFFQQYPWIATTSWHYFYGPFSQVLQKRAHVALDRGMMAEIDLLDAGRSSISTDVSNVLEKIQNAAKSLDPSEKAVAGSYCEEILRGIAEPLGAFMKGKSERESYFLCERELAVTIAEKTKELLGRFFEFGKKLPEDFARSLQMLNFLDTKCTELLSNNFEHVYYVKQYNSVITLVAERTNLQIEISVLTGKSSWAMIDTTFSTSFQYLLPLTSVVELEGTHGTSLPPREFLPAQHDELAQFGAVLQRYKKVLCVCYQNTRTDKLYDLLSPVLATKEAPVLAMGKSGGTQKNSA